MQKNSRPYDALSLVAQKVSSDGGAPKGRSRGVAVTECFGSSVAFMAEVSVDDPSI